MAEILVDVSKCLACRSCEMACAINRDSVARTLIGAAREDPVPQPRVTVQGTETFSMPVQCRHCEEAPCLWACPSGALYRHEETGAVAAKPELCIGCWMCVAVCPFGAVKPARAGRVSFKCDRCTGMEHPFCVDACPTGALAYKEPGELRFVAEVRSRSVVDAVAGDPGSTAREHGCSFWKFGLETLEKLEEGR